MKMLDVTKPQGVKYCIETWMRDEQIKLAIQRVTGRIQPGERKDGRVAVVGFGPSLRETWEQIKDFPVIISCSGSHKFLVERGIVPTYHVEVDPRSHKVQLIGTPQTGTKYLIASTCHPKVFDHLEGQDVQLWHVFDNKADAIRTLPHGEWAITGGCDVGLRAMTIAGFLGFRDLHVFGLDGCEGVFGKHADLHPNEAKGHALCEFDGETYKTTPALLEAARQVQHELEQMPAVTATFYGTGLIQAMAKHYPATSKAEPDAFANVVGFAKPTLISAEYVALNRQLHRENLAYGVGGGKHAPTVEKLAASIKTRSVLDYGCGKGYLAKALPFPIWEYDPAIPEKAESPRPADLVVATDVLEHIEPEKLGFVLDDLRRCVRQVGYFVISTRPAQKMLPDGRNTHLLVHGEQWWKKRLAKFFAIGKIMATPTELHVVVSPKQKVAA